MKSAEITILEQLLVVNLDVHIWSARKKLMPLDLGDATLPPEELASLGSKRVCNPDDLTIFGTLKARAVSLLERIGIRFLGGWAIPEARLEEIDNGLLPIKEDFTIAKTDFLNRYEQSVREWIAKHPGWEEIIANSIVSQDYVRSRLDFRWQIFKVATPALDRQSQDNLEQDVQSLGSTLYEEIAKSATETWKNCYAGKNEITRKALSPLKSMYDKLMGMTFVEPRVSSIASLINTALNSIPKRGPITGSTLLMLQGLVSLLRTPAEIVSHGQKILEGQQPGDVLAGLGSFPAPPIFVDVSATDSNRKSTRVKVPVPPSLESCGLW